MSDERRRGIPPPDELDAVTLDAYDTLLELDDHIERLEAALARAGAERPRANVERAFAAEVEYYSTHKCEARDAVSLAKLQRECAGVFADALALELDFTDAFAAAICLRPLPGVLGALRQLHAHGLSLAVVSNWDCSLSSRLERAGIVVDTVVTCAEAGVAKPEPAIFEVALGRLGVQPSRTLHIGDSEADEQGAAAAGVHFAPAPLPSVVARWS